MGGWGWGGSYAQVLRCLEMSFHVCALRSKHEACFAFLYSLSSLFPPSHCVPCLVELAASGGSWRWSFIKGPVVLLITGESEHRYSCYLGCDYIAFPHTFVPMKSVSTLVFYAQSTITVISERMFQ